MKPPIALELLAAGNRFGGYSLFVKDRRFVYEYNFGEVRYVVRSDREVPVGRNVLRMEFAKTGPQRGTATLLIDGERVGGVDIPRTWPFIAAQAGLHCGRDDGSPVSDQYEAPFRFTGTLRHVIVELADDQQLDAAAERQAVVAED